MPNTEISVPFTKLPNCSFMSISSKISTRKFSGFENGLHNTICLVIGSQGVKGKVITKKRYLVQTVFHHIFYPPM